MTSFRRRRACPLFAMLSMLCVAASLLTVESRAIRADTPPLSTPYRWHNVPIVGGGFVDGLQFHPAQRGLAYARTDVGGAYRWDDAARRWVAITDGFGFEQWNYTGIESLAIDPTDPRRLYAAVGTYTNDWAGNGAILRSDDQGRNWQVTEMPFKMGGNEGGRFAGERLAVDPQFPATLYFGSRHDGLWRSLDRGATWSRVTSFPIPPSGKGGASGDVEGIGVVFVDFDTEKNKAPKGAPTRTLFVGVSSREGGLWRSDDAGATFAPVAGQPKGLLVNHGVRGADGWMYLSYGDNPGPNGMTDGAVWKWNPRTGAWANITPQTAAQNGGRGFGYAGLALDARHPGTLMVATIDRWNPGDTLFRSTDGGAHWTDVGPKSVRDASLSPWLTWGRPGPVALGHWIGALTIDPFDAGHVLYGTGATIWASRDANRADAGQPTHWIVGAEGLEETVVNDLASPPSGDTSLFSAVYDIDGFRHTKRDASPPDGFFHPSHGSNGGIDFAESNPNIVARTFWGNGAKGAYSLDNGKTWTDFAASPAGGGGGGKIAVSADGATFVWSPDHGASVYSRDRGATWTTCARLSPSVRRVIADRAAPNRFYAFDGTTGTVWASEDGGANFAAKSIDLPRGDGEMRAVPGHAGDLWLATRLCLWHATDTASPTFTPVGAAKGFRLAFGKAAPGHDYPTLYLAGTLGGVDGLYRSLDKGATWTRIDDDRHRFGGVNALAADERVFGRVYIGTSGRGIVRGDVK